MADKLIDIYKKGYNRDYLSFDSLINDEEKLNFIRGLVEANGTYFDDVFALTGDFTNTLTDYLCTLTLKPIQIRPDDNCTYLCISGDRAKDFLGMIYNNFQEDLFTLNKDTVTWLKNKVFDYQKPLQFYLEDKDAVLPTKAYLSDTGYDLTIIKKVKDLGNKTALYDTGIVVVPPDGYYTRVVGRSSISKTGYTLANCEGIIDNAYRGTIKVALHKYDDTKPDIECPHKIAQLIMEKRYDLPVEIIKEKPLSVRGEGGFGSTNKK